MLVFVLDNVVHNLEIAAKLHEASIVCKGLWLSLLALVGEPLDNDEIAAAEGLLRQAVQVQALQAKFQDAGVVFVPRYISSAAVYVRYCIC